MLLLALEEYFHTSSAEVLAKLYDAINAVPMTGYPDLSRSERILLRSIDDRDLFEEKFTFDPLSDTKEIFDETSSEAGQSLEEGSVSSHQRRLGSSTGSNRPASSNAKPSLPRAGSASSSQMHLATPSSRDGGRWTPDTNYAAEVQARPAAQQKDTHFFETHAKFLKISVPIRIPLTVFDEDVGDVSTRLREHG